MAMSLPVKKATELIKLYSAESILEVGCGRGGIISQFHASVRIGVDSNKDFIEEARRTYPGILFIEQVAAALPLIWYPGAFDAVIGFDILEHLPEVEMHNVIQNCEDIAKKLVIFFSPLDEAGLAMHPEGDNDVPGMRHVTIIKEEVFIQRGYSTFKYPHYFYGTHHGSNITAMLAIKEM